VIMEPPQWFLLRVEGVNCGYVRGVTLSERFRAAVTRAYDERVSKPDDVPAAFSARISGNTLLGMSGPRLPGVRGGGSLPTSARSRTSTGISNQNRFCASRTHVRRSKAISENA
jgi:ABC-type transporter Mla subunit MlaD